MIFPSAAFWIIYAVSLVFCCIGFYKFVWFLSVGYGLSAAGIGATLLVMSIVNGTFTLPFALFCLLFIVYGIRLSGFLLVRQLKNVKYQEKMREVGGDAKVPVFVAFFMWLICGFLYVMQSGGAVYRLLNRAEDNIALYIGIVISAIGIVIESLADKQKGEAKKINPDMPAMQGLYKMCRCPNYFGEILFWSGVIVSGIGAVQGWQWLIAGLGYITIVYIMLSGAKRVEGRHIKHYGNKPEYNAYADNTPLIFPLIPLYHMTNPEKMAKEEAAKAAKKAKASK